MKIRLTALLFVVALTGCTRALVATYEPGVDLENNVISGKKLAVHPFEDERSWIDAGNEKSTSFIAKQGAWKFGLKYEGVEYQPVSLILQDVFIKDFKEVGVDAYKASETSDPAYSLKGRILNFEFENETGVWTVTSRRHVSLALTLLDPDGNELLAGELFNEVSRENEGMGVLHSTNVDKLMKDALKKVVVGVINRTNVKLSHLGVDMMKVTVNGVDVTDAVGFGSYARL